MKKNTPESSAVHFIATQNDEKRTLIKYLIKMLNNVPISKVYKLIRQKKVKINNEPVKDSAYRLKKGDVVQIFDVTNYHRKTTYKKVEVNFDVNYEDKNILVVDKPINIAIHTAINCLNDQVRQYLKFQQKDSFQIAAISRLDKPSSGLIIYAKNYETLRQLTAKINNFDKYYQFVAKKIKPQQLELKLKYNHTTQKSEVHKHGQIAITEFSSSDGNQFAKLVTGRKHQIRASLAYLKAPILGDAKYGGKPAKRLFLHCQKITLQKLSEPLAYLNNRSFISKKKLNNHL